MVLFGVFFVFSTIVFFEPFDFLTVAFAELFLVLLMLLLFIRLHWTSLSLENRPPCRYRSGQQTKKITSKTNINDNDACSTASIHHGDGNE